MPNGSNKNSIEIAQTEDQIKDTSDLSCGAPTPQLHPGHLLDGDIEIISLERADSKKNVYTGIHDSDTVLILEQYQEDIGVTAEIEEECRSLFPEHILNFTDSARIYAVFETETIKFLSDMSINCWEPDIIKLIYDILSSAKELLNNGFAISSITMADIFSVNDKFKILVFPAAFSKAESNKIDETTWKSSVCNLIRDILLTRLEPSMTRDMENPLKSFCFSDEFSDFLSEFIKHDTADDITKESIKAENIKTEDIKANIKYDEFEKTINNWHNFETAGWDICADTDMGMVRDNNEDACCQLSGSIRTYQNASVFTALAVADGMGGHEKGEVASHFILTTWLQLIFDTFITGQPLVLTNPEISSLMDKIVRKTAEKFLNSEDFRKIPVQLRPGATLTAALIVERIAFIVNTGDSRTYLIREGNIKPVTKDHSYVQLCIDRGELNEQEARDHEQNNIITSFIGIDTKEFKMDTYVHRLEPEDMLMLCSDGLTGMLTDEEILQIIQKEDTAKQMVNTLISAANDRGGNDNISVVLMRDQTEYIPIK